MSYLSIIQSLYYIFLCEKVHIDWLHHRREDWLGTRYDWLGLCPTISNLCYATDFSYQGGCGIKHIEAFERRARATDKWFQVISNFVILNSYTTKELMNKAVLSLK